MSPHQPTLFILALVLTALAVASGCTPDTARWSQVEAPKDNKINFVTATHAVHFAADSDALAPGEAQALTQFLTGEEAGFGSQVTIDTGPPRGVPAADELTAKRAEVVSGLLRRLNMPGESAKRPSVEAALGHDEVIVAVGRYVVTPPVCPDWRKPDDGDYTNTPSSNFGCATTTSLGLMVANPADLLRGTPGGPADGEFAARGIELYRKGLISKSLEPELSRGGAAGGGGGGGGGGGW
jgi:pilus assembly protein CpaD